jgi:AcrR family transcriptional regulator
MGERIRTEGIKMARKLSKEEIIRALLDCSFYRSTGATSLADIADKLGVKKASLYNHFESRDAIVSGAIEYCAAYLRTITFMPSDIDSVAQKYPAESVLKGIVNRYFKMHEKLPLFQIYTFVESQKYFFKAAADIVLEEQNKIYLQTRTVLQALEANKKIRIAPQSIPHAALWFSRGITSTLSDYLIPKKQQIMENPATGEGELFSLPSDNHALEEVDRLIDRFTLFIQPEKSLPKLQQEKL